MKNKIAAMLLAVSALTAPLAAHATLFWYDGFQYSNGPVIFSSIYNPSGSPGSVTATNSYWIRESGSAAPTPDSFTIASNLQVCATGGSIISRQDDMMRLFYPTNFVQANQGFSALSSSGNYGNYTNNPNNPPQLIYASFTVICTTSITNFPFTNSPAIINQSNSVINGVGLPNGPGSYFASFYNDNGGGYCGRVQAFTNNTVLPNTWRLGVTDNALATNLGDGGFPVDLAVNTPYQVVEEFDPTTLKAATIWINPINIYQTGNSSVDPSYTASDKSNFALTNALNSYAFRQPSSFGNAAFLITNCAVATTFAEAFTNVCSTNAAPPTIAYQPAAYQTNFQNSTMTVSAVANGQGLASMTYQWQVSSSTNAQGQPVSPANISGGDLSANNNILTINPAESGDSGFYTLIATTPYGLSTTSSVAQVVVVTGAFPPQFVSQPGSQQIYSGQSTAFQVKVSTPGTPSYTWYSNNIVVSSSSSPSPQQSDSGDISTYSFNAAPTNFSATYFVAVTNNLTTSGIVSTNAVLTVLNPAQVTIAYLRTLVSATAAGGAYFPTNSPPSIPYQVTGTVTTFTNLTSGNTASYYLQDGTAGIDIFVTGGSSFRPAQGDVVTFIGVLSGFTSGLELDADSTAGSLYPYTSYVDTGTNVALPTPVYLTYNNLTNIPYANTNLGGRYVTLPDVHFGTNAGFVTSTSVNQAVGVTNSSGKPFNLEFLALDDNTTNQILPAYAYDVTGVVYGINTNFDVAVTRIIDIATNPPGITLTVSTNITVTLQAGQTSSNVTYSASVASGGCFTPNVVSTPASGSAFTVGATVVSCTATDVCGETVVSNFTVTVISGAVIVTNTPQITGFSIVSTNVVVNATNGQTGGTYYLLSSTNVALPFSQWTPVATNVAASTNFTVIGTNVVTPGTQFYILSSTNK
jgi:hypothetical protein